MNKVTIVDIDSAMAQIADLNNNSVKSEVKTNVTAVFGIKLKMLFNELQPIMKVFNDAKNEMFDKWGGEVIKNEQGQDIKQIKEEFLEEFKKEYGELMKIEYTIVTQLDMSDLKAVVLPIEFCTAIEPFIVKG